VGLRARRHPADPVLPRRERLPAPGVEEPLVGQVQGALGQVGGRGRRRLVGGAAGVDVQRQHFAAAHVPAQVDLQGGPLAGAAAAAAGELAGQGRGEGGHGRVLDDDCREAVEQAQAPGLDLQGLPQRLDQQGAQEGPGAGAQALPQGLRGDLQLAGQGPRRGLGLGHPAEHQGLREGGSGQPALPPQEAGGPAQGLRRGREQPLQHHRQARKVVVHRGAPFPKDESCDNYILGKEFLLHLERYGGLPPPPSAGTSPAARQTRCCGY
jgi:hypothetical protein